MSDSLIVHASNPYLFQGYRGATVTARANATATGGVRETLTRQEDALARAVDAQNADYAKPAGDGTLPTKLRGSIVDVWA